MENKVKTILLCADRKNLLDIGVQISNCIYNKNHIYATCKIQKWWRGLFCTKKYCKQKWYSKVECVEYNTMKLCVVCSLYHYYTFIFMVNIFRILLQLFQ